ncbi:MAG: hypothetical protein R2856_26675 [Caldilineaceae bacterium]
MFGAAIDGAGGDRRVALALLLAAPAAGRPTAQVWFRYGLVALLFTNRRAGMWHWVNGQWTVQTMLPLHLCSVLVYGSAPMLVNQNFTAFSSLPTSWAWRAPRAAYGISRSTAFPTTDSFWQTYAILHGGIVLAAIFMVAVAVLPANVAFELGKSLRAKRMSTWRSWGSSISWVTTCSSSINHLIASLLDVLGPWPWYIPSLEALGMAICLLLMLPFVRAPRAGAQSAPSTQAFCKQISKRYIDRG